MSSMISREDEHVDRRDLGRLEHDGAARGEPHATFAPIWFSG